MKKTWFTAAVLGAVLMLGVSACSSAGTATSPGPSLGAAGDAAVLASVGWSEDDAGIPTLEFDTPLVVSAPAARRVNEGDGAVVEAGQTVTLDYTITNAADGTAAYSTYDAGQPESIPLVDGTVEPVLLDAIVGSKVGADILYAAVDTSDTTGNGTILVAATITAAITPLARAEGTAVAPVAGLPKVTLADNGAPSVSIPASDPPTKLVVQPLIVGAGPVVAEGQSVTVHYTGWLWDGTQFDSSWDGGAPLTFSLAQGALIDGWVQGLAGQPVGSQVLLVVPPALGYGDNAQGAIPAGSTLVFVVDILAAT